MVEGKAEKREKLANVACWQPVERETVESSRFVSGIW